ncbi:hypothetical protein Avi_9854 (plasmid) [Allorhizobium ampelinum S4]|uniref:DUF2946 domain-containing protein n=2 Tax=Hyphomicrobiales TaxID=356 RepID=B9K623_ALLAM|nr:hypothetical protein Avi_9854 [Allorhizobium ampelinum S4]
MPKGKSSMFGRSIKKRMCLILAILLILSNIHGTALAGGASADHCPSISSLASSHDSKGSVGHACCPTMICCPILVSVDVLGGPDRRRAVVFVAVEQPISLLFLRPDYPPPKLLS